MRKMAQYFAVAAMVLLALPAAALAHNGGDGDNDGHRKFIGSAVRMIDDDDEDNDRNDRRGERFSGEIEMRGNFRAGTVTGIASDSFTLKAHNGVVYTVNTADATFSLPFKGAFNESDLEVNDGVKVKGTVNDTTITAELVLVIPANTRPAVAKGTVTAVNGNEITLSTKHNGEITVNTDSNTTVMDSDGDAIVVADIEVGSEVKAKGLWDMVVDTFHAIAIKLHLK